MVRFEKLSVMCRASLLKEAQHLHMRLSESYKQEEWLEEENRELRRTRLKNFNKEEYWIFMDDGEDYPESLVCPVTMSASKLRELLKCREELKVIKGMKRNV